MLQRFAARVLFIGLALAAPACGNDEEPGFRDRTGPRVLSTEPADGATDIDIRPDITVVFSEAILVVRKLSPTRIEEFDYTAFRVTDPEGTEVKGFITFNNDTLVFRASNPLAYSTQYTVTMTSGIKDLFGNRGKPHAFSFTTLADTVPPNPPYALVYPTLTNKTAVKLEGAKDPGTSVRINGKDAGAVAASDKFTATLKLIDGDNEFTLTAVDPAGNESLEATVAITLDRTPPAALTACGAAGLRFHTETGESACWDPPATVYWNNRAFLLKAEWTPGTGETAVVRMGNEGSPGYTAAKISYDLFQPALHAGETLTLKAYTVDQAGNQSLPFQRTMVFDEIAELTARDGAAALVTNADAASFTFDKEAGAVLFAALDGQRAGSCAAGVTVCTVSLTGLADGTHSFAATATDAAGNETRIVKLLTVDTTPPQAFTLPRDNAEASQNPLLHVFANEPVTVVTADVDAGALTPVSDAASGGTHWTFTPPSLSEAAHTATVVLRDAAGNARTLAWTFTASSTYASAPPAATYATPAPAGALREGRFTVAGMPTAALNVVRYAHGTAAGAYAYAATTAGTVTASAEALSLLTGAVRSYDDDGDYNEAPLPAFNPFYPGAPSLEGAFAQDGASYGTARGYGAGDGFVWFTTDGYAKTVDRAGGVVAELFCTVFQSLDQAVPLLAQAEPWTILGVPCGLKALSLNDPVAPGFALWNPAGESMFGAAVTGAAFFGDGNQQIAVGSPLGSGGRLYMYAASTATAPAFVLRGDPAHTTARFGSAAAFAGSYYTFPANRSALAVMAANENAIYFFDDSLWTNRLASTLPLYRGRWAWPSSCAVGTLRFELIGAGDVNGDGHGDFAAARYCDLTSPHVVNLAVFLGGNGAAAGGPVTQTAALTLPSSAASAFRPHLVAAGDLDGDGRDDLTLADRTNGAGVRILYGTPSGVLRQALVTPEAAGAEVTWLVGGTMDADLDGRPDLILGKSDPLAPLSEGLILRTLP